jgi:Oligosaccaryltransferase
MFLELFQWNEMESDQRLRYISNMLGMSIMLLIVFYHFVAAAPQPGTKNKRKLQ